MNDDAITLARQLRLSSTEAERLLWRHLRDRQLEGYKFRRQRPIAGYVVDFVCMERMLIVEVDGGQHEWQSARDQRRTAILEAAGYRVVRFWNNDVLSNAEGVLQQILLALADKR